MKINKLINGWRLLAVLAVAMSAAACSDGELASQAPVSITPPPPVIITFAADPTTVKSGGSTTISWEVAGADTIEITAVSTGAAPNFNVSTKELSGSAQATNLTADTDFVLTAKKSAAVTEAEGEGATNKSGQIRFGPEPDDSGGTPAPQPSESSVTQTITVHVTSGQINTSITTDKSPVAACEETIIRWTSEGTTTEVTADSGEVIVAKDQCPQTGDLAADIAAIKAAVAVDPTPANGCAVVKPCDKTVYTVKATDESGGEGSSSVTVDVTAGDVTAKIFAGKSEGEKKENMLVVGSYKDPVFVSWKATPTAAKVTVTASPAVAASAGSPCELPKDATNKSEAGTKCLLSGETKFVISATLGSKTETDEVDVVLMPATGAGLVVAEKWALEGEKTSVEMALTQDTKPHAKEIVNKVFIDNNEINAADFDKLIKGENVTVKDVVAKPPFVRVKMIYNKTQSVEYKPIPVVELVVKRLDDDVARVSSAAITPEMTRLTGVQLSTGFSGGNARMYKDGGARNFNFGDPIMEAFDMKDDWNEGFFNALKTYPVAVAARENKSEEIYASVTGADMRSKDGGDTWENIRVSRVQANPDHVSHDHPTCGRADDGRQKTQVGVEDRFPYDFISLSQTCDILALENGMVILGTDWGIRYEDNVDDENWSWKGKPNVGQSGAEAGKPTYNHVVNKVIKAGDKYFAAADNGVFVSSDAETWAAFGGISGPVWTIIYDSRNKKLYAGTETGVMDSPLDSANWKQVLGMSQPAIALAIDPSADVAATTLIAGTPKGVMITRDGGASWQSLVLKDGEQPVEALAIAAKAEGQDDVKYVITMGTPSGELFQGFTVGRKKLDSEDGSDDSKKVSKFVQLSEIVHMLKK